MNIIQQPDSLSLSLNLKEFLITSDVQVSFALRQGDTEILSQRYDPPTQGYITINLRDIIHGRLSFQLKEIGSIYQQLSLVADFTAVIDTTEVSFRVIRSGVDRLSDSARNFLTQNFLTWQPTIKPVTYYSPEFLTYYAVVNGSAKMRAYFTDESGIVTSQLDYTISELVVGIAYTIPLQYSVVAGLLDHKLPAYYDVWIEDSSGNRLTYIQRYYAENMRSEQEQWILFENSLGGVDTFRAYGSTIFNGEHTHNIAEVDEVSQEYHVDTERKFEKNTGHLNNDERKWLLDFFPSPVKYIYIANYLRRIVVTESNVNYTDRELPSNYTFTFKYADAQPLLNLPRTDVPADLLNITVPDIGSFTIPPRLAEFSRLSLSGGVLFPVQNPYSEVWATTTTDAIATFLADYLSKVYGAGGGIGHKHRNFSLLELLSYIDRYLLVDGQKIKAGYADVAGELKEDKYLHKDRDDATHFLLSLFAGAIFGKDGFASGMTGFGARIDENGNGEMESLILRRFLEVPELRYNRISVTLGDKWNAPGAGIIEQIEPDMDGDGNLQMTGTGYLKLEEGEYGAIDVGDICMGIFHSEKAEDNATADSDDSCGNFQYAGFYTCYFTITEITGSNNKQFRYQLRPVSERWKLTFHPCQAMHFVCYGSFTNVDRQTSTYTTRTYTRRLWKQNTWEISAANIASQSGDLSNLAVHGLQMSGYSEYVNNVYLTGVIKQIKPDGTPVLTVNDRGAWTTGMKCDFYDRVSYDGRIWLCINEDGTSARPSKGNVDWLLQVDKGADGTSFTIKDKLDDISQLPAEGNSIGDGYLIVGHLWVWNGQTFEDKGSIQGPAGQSVSVLGRWQTGIHVPYLGIVKMGTATWMCTVPAGTDNPPMWTITDKDGNRLLQTQDGGKTYGYILTGTENSTEYIMIAQDGTDGIPGEPGKDGKVLYTWIRYADDAQGNGISDSPIGKKFLGLAHNKETSVESNDPEDYLWSDIKGEDGIGTPGNDGKTYYTWVAYSDNADGSGMYQQPNENTKYIGIAVNKEAAVESTDPTDYTWSKFKGEDGKDGEDGDNVSNHGQWQTGKHIPYLGIVRMGNTTWQCTVPAGTDNPPMWTITDKDGNRLLQTQDGGKTYGYILTGELNTAEYELVARDGTDGKDGESIKGDPGIQGCIIRRGEWKIGVEWRNDESLTSGTRYLDVALIRDDQVATGWKAYKCKTTHTSSLANAPGNSTYWEEFGLNTTAIFTSLIIAKDAQIDFMQGNQLIIKKDDGTVTAGLSGTQSGEKIRMWAGSPTPDDAPFRVTEDGKVHAENAEITGEVNATSGVFKNIRSPNGAFRILDNGNIEIIGKVSTSSDGTRIVVDPNTNSIKIYNQDNNEVGDISFLVEEWAGTTNYYPRLRLKRYSGAKEVGRIDISASSLSAYSILGANTNYFDLSPNGLVFSLNGKVTKEYPNR